MQNSSGPRSGGALTVVTRNSDCAVLQAFAGLEKSWRRRLGSELGSTHIQSLRAFLDNQKRQGKTIFPANENLFAALNHTPFEKVRVVILGQDPYHGMGQAHGLCFSVPEGVRPPPSLKNIIKELATDMGIAQPTSFGLEAWADQGVLLLNSVLTVEEGKAGAHQGQGWEKFTDRVIQLLNEERQHLVFILWGAYAQKKAAFVDRQKHLVIECVHPSPLSSHRGFFGSRPFSKTNAYLKTHHQGAIDWTLG